MTNTTASNISNEQILLVRHLAEFAENHPLATECERAAADPHPMFGTHATVTRARATVADAFNRLVLVAAEISVQEKI
jgi:hypothetical protein